MTDAICIGVGCIGLLLAFVLGMLTERVLNGIRIWNRYKNQGKSE